MIELTLQEAQPRLKELLKRAETGDAIAIRSDSGARILLTIDRVEAGEAAKPATSPKRIFGQWKGLFEVGPEFFEPMPEDWLNAFYNGPVFTDQPTAAEASEPKVESL